MLQNVFVYVFNVKAFRNISGFFFANPCHFRSFKSYTKMDSGSETETKYLTEMERSVCSEDIMCSVCPFLSLFGQRNLLKYEFSISATYFGISSFQPCNFEI